MLFSKLTRVLSVLALWGCSNNLFADFMTVPTGLLPGTEYRLAFATSGTIGAGSSAISDYNTFVTTQANLNPLLAALATSWTAIGSTPSVDARDNTNTNPTISVGLPIYRLDGLIVANDNADLWDGSISNSISLNQSGAALTGSAWTGTGPNGTGLSPLQLGSDPVQYGLVLATNNQWVSFGEDLSGGIARVYAVSGTLIVAPEPGSMMLVGAGAILGVFARRQRRA